MTQIVKTEKGGFEFNFNFEALREMDDERGHNCFMDAAVLAEGESKPLLVSEILEVALVRVGDKEIAPGEAKEAAMLFISIVGYQEAHTVAQKLLAYVLIGDEKKSGLQSLEQVIAELRKNSNASPSMTFTTRLSVWTYRIGTFGIWIWLIFSEFGLRSL